MLELLLFLMRNIGIAEQICPLDYSDPLIS